MARKATMATVGPRRIGTASSTERPTEWVGRYRWCLRMASQVIWAATLGPGFWVNG